MGASEKMFDWDQEWNISFAGCGFRSIYHLGALSCILERVPRLVHGASKVCGASSGCLVAAALAVGIPIEQFSADVLNLAKEARKHTLGVFHPTFSLLRAVRTSLLEKLPADAHLRASGRLCVSLTRLSDRSNVLVSEFGSREELIQALMCSCFFPVYCGFIPPSYHGVLYMDGALSNNLPLFEQRNTITVAPFSGESDICPREGTFNFLEVHYGNVSIQVNTGNVHRICTSFLPPAPEALAEICHSGYTDALRFLTERGLLGTRCLLPGLTSATDAVTPTCCEPLEEESRETLLNGNDPHQDRKEGLKVSEDLPAGIRKVLCEACRDGHCGDTRRSWATELLPVRAAMCLLSLLLLPVELLLSLSKSMLSLLRSASGLCRQTWSDEGRDPNGSEHLGSSSCDSALRAQTGSDEDIEPLTSSGAPNRTLQWDNNMNLYSFTSICSDPSNTPACGGETQNRRRNRM